MNIVLMGEKNIEIEFQEYFLQTPYPQRFYFFLMSSCLSKNSLNFKQQILSPGEN